MCVLCICLSVCIRKYIFASISISSASVSSDVPFGFFLATAAAVAAAAASLLLSPKTGIEKNIKAKRNGKISQKNDMANRIFLEIANPIIILAAQKKKKIIPCHSNARADPRTGERKTKTI